ncbi:MAG: 50S ribosomal protein L18 [Minisyncoccota bacterium]
MKTNISKTTQRIRRKLRIRAKISGTEIRPRLAVFKSNQYVSAQLIDDSKGITIASSHSKTMKGKTLSEKALAVGKDIATKAKAKKVEMAVFDRGGFMYTGNIKAIAEGAREGGLIF